MKRLLVVFLGVSAFGAGAATINVDYATGADEDGASVYKTLTFAAAKAQQDDTIILARGPQYLTGTTTFNTSVTIRGEGENSETTLAGWDTNSTLLYMKNGGLIHNLTIYGCFGDGHANVRLYLDGGGTVVSNVVVTAPSTNPGAPWGEMMIEMNDAQSVITHCWMTNCVAKQKIVKANTGKAIENCVISGNRSTTADSTGLIYLYNFSSMRHCTVTGNSLVSGKAVWVQNNGTGASLDNNIIWGNYVSSTLDAANVGYNVARHTGNFHSNCSTPITDWPIGSGNIDADPLLLEDGVRILFDSPCNRAGNPDYALPTDILLRPRAANPSMGAFEAEAPDRMFCTVQVVGDASVRVPAAVQLNCLVEGKVTNPLAFAWDFNGDGQVDATVQSPEITAPGLYRPIVTVTDAAQQTVCVTSDVPVVVRSTGAQTYWVDYAKGRDSAASAVYKTLCFAATQVAEGDTVVLSRGLHFLTNAAAFTVPVTIRGEGEKDETILFNEPAKAYSFSMAGGLLHNVTMINTRDSTGAEMRFSMSGSTVVSNIVGTSYGDRGGPYVGKFIEASGGLITHSWFTNGVVGAVVHATGGVKIENCYFANNQGTANNNLLNFYYSDPILRNCTIVSNRLNNGSAVYNIGNGSGALLYNNIVWGNIDSAKGEEANVKPYYDKFKARHFSNCMRPLDGWPAENGNFSDDPQLNPDGLTFRVGSPCRNAGNDSCVTAGEKDLLGQPRIFGKHVDVGCFELQKGYGFMMLVR